MFKYSTFEEFIKQYNKIQTSKCPKCGGVMEVCLEDIAVNIEDKTMEFLELPILKCTHCNQIALSYFSKKQIKECFNEMSINAKAHAFCESSGYRRKFEYCKQHDLKYDHRDYFSIPFLRIDHEHDKLGFLTPVYFSQKALLYFLHDEDYIVNLGAETYGEFRKKEDWIIPFGINSNRNIVFWLGDLEDIDEATMQILKSFNIDSDHKLTSSEFYTGQIENICANPNKEARIYHNRKELFEILNKKFNVDLFHLDKEIKKQLDEYEKPITINHKNIEPTIALLHQMLIEGVDIEELRKIYVGVVPSLQKDYKTFRSNKLFEGILKACLNDNYDIYSIMSPLYVLDGYRHYFDHLFPEHKKEDIRHSIIQSFNVESFDDIDIIYTKLLDGLLAIINYLIIGYKEC